MSWFAFMAGVVFGGVVSWLFVTLLKTNKLREIENKAIGYEKTIDEIRKQLQEKEDRNNKLSEMFVNEHWLYLLF